ncbi:cadherin-like beta sandwich domain-containing protein [Maribellus sediminis]|uniref:cadherin-like beta sandwich domain-containing protein n=1 Tax=Maribellus sediminis TaxID=2696285 RepID=UPI0014310F40|nr:cadherin-like beta sandwich domain-containing protein [Maribellus sediminis]
MNKKTLLQKIWVGFMLFALAGIINNGAWAQTWEAPSYYGEVPTSGTAYYIYNVGADAFLNRGGEWTAEAVISAQPKDLASNAIVSWTSVNSAGEWTFQYTNNGTPAGGRYLFQVDDGNGWIFTDGSSNNKWNITETDGSNHVFAIQVSSTASYYNSSVFLGAQTSSRTTNKGIAVSVRYNEPASDHTQWKFVSQANYDLYQAKVLLDKYMNYATKITGGPDITSYISIYNSDVTANIATAATNLLAELTPTDVTDSIVNPSFESDLAGWTNDNFWIQSTSGIGWTKDGSKFSEQWISASTYLPASSITQTLNGLDNGIYELVFSAHAVKQKVDSWNIGSTNPLHSGAFLKAGVSSTEVSAGGEYSVDYISVTNGSLTIGYELKAPIAVNWTAFDNFRLYYYGEGPSNDATLSGISLSAGSLVQDFDPAVTSYFATLPQGTTSVDVSATKTDSNASITSGTGTITLTDGEASTDIEITAEDGSTKKTYTIVFKAIELMHSYTFEDGTFNSDTVMDVIGDADGTLVGGASISGGQLVLDKEGEYVSFVPTELGLSSYNSMTMEFIYSSKIGANDGHWNWAAYFGGDGGANSLMTGLRTWGQYRLYKNNNIKIQVNNSDDGGLHHVVAIMTDSEILFYADGVRIGKTAAPDNAIEELHAWLGLAPWGDPTWQGKIEEFNIYDGVMDSDTIAARADLLKNSNANLSSLSASAGTLFPAFDKTLTDYVIVIPKDLSSIDISAAAQVVGASISGTGTINMSGGSKSIKITVTSLDGNFNKTYNIDLIVEDPYCYRGAFANNLIDDPEITDDSYWGGWGSSSIVYGLEAYCGTSAGKVDASGSCGGSLDTKTINWLPNTTYMVRAKVKTNGTFTIGAQNVYGDQWGNHSSENLVVPNTHGEWEDFEATFTTNSYPGSGVVYFNNCEGANGTKGYIDNWELYDRESDNTDLISLSSPQGEITPTIMPSRDAYYLKYSLSSVQDSIIEINAVPRFESATVIGTGEYRVDGGITIVQIYVTSRSGNRRAYVVQIEPNFDDASLLSLTTSTGFLEPDFDSEIMDYELIVPVGTDSVELSAEKGDPEASMAGAGTYYLTNDSAMAEIVVTSRDGNITRTYKVSIVAKESYSLAHSYTFDDGTANDVIGGADGSLKGDAVVANGELTISGTGYVELPAEKIQMSKYRGVTIESVFRQAEGLGGFTTLFSAGDTRNGWMGADYIIWQPTRNDDDYSRTSISCENYSNPWTSESAVNAGKIADTETHYAVTVINKTEIKLYIDGELIGTDLLSDANMLENVSNNLAYIGASVYPGDPKWEGSLDELNIFEGELDSSTIAQRASEFLGGASHDATLSSLTVDPGELTPVFDASTTSYLVVIPEGADTINVEAIITDENATVEGLGAVDVSTGSGTATVVVTAEDGTTQKTYTIEFEMPSDLEMMHSYTFEEGTFDATTVYDQIGSVDGTLGGSKISIADGKATVSGATTNSDGWISLDGADLALNTYHSGITIEAYLETGQTLNSSFTMLAYFGTSTPGNGCFWIQPTRSGTETRIETNNGSTTINAIKSGYEVDDNKMHHLVAVLSSHALIYYLDGVVLAQASTGGADYISTIGTDVANIFRGVDGWNDPNYNASIHEFNIYNGVMDPSMVQEHSDAFLNSSDARLSALTSDIGTVAPEVDGTTTHFAVLVPEGSTSVTLTAIPYVSAATVSGDGEIDLSGGDTIVLIKVTSADGTITNEYTVDIIFDDATCAASLHPDNIVPDPEMTDLSMYAGWGTRIIAYGTEAYCGVSSMKVQGSCGGSLDVDLDATGKLTPNTTYRMRAMVYVGGSGKFKIGWFGTAVPDHVIESKHNDMWEMLDTTFTTGEDISNFGMYFNSCEGMNGEVGWIDNWEVFPVSSELSSDATLADLSIDGTTVDGFNPDTMSYDVLLPIGTESALVDAVVNNTNATVAGTGTVDMTSGSGSATIVVTAEDGSTTSTYNVNITVDTNTAIDDFKTSLIKVYPTISAKEFNVAFDGIQPGNIKVYNMYGQVVLDINATSAIEKVNVSHAGMYFIRVETGGFNKVVKVLKTE